jgi:hypothetical protein
MTTNYHELAMSMKDAYGAAYEKMLKWPEENCRYYKEVRSLLHRLVCSGFKLIMVDDGEEFIKVEGTMAETKMEAAAAICNVGEAQLLVENPEGEKKWIMLVLGNDPGELVADCHVDPDLDRITEEHYEKWSK